MELFHTSLFMSGVFWSFLLHGFLLSSAESATLFTNETDRLALLAFKDAISDDPNGVLSAWNDSLHFCMWGGVTCSKRHPQRVAALNLGQMGLVGSLSPHIANLSFLRLINLTINSFEGQIPREVGRLHRLQYLSLQFNSFDGDIPKNITRCSELQVLDLFDNKLLGEIPIELDSLPMLNWLNLGKNSLTGNISRSLGNLSSLTYLYLSDNSLEGSIPDDLGHLVNLNSLGLGGNRFSGMVPSSLYNLSSVIGLDVGSNLLHGSLPPGLGLTLPNLERLYFGDNHFTGPIPVSLANASKLLYIDLGLNNFSGPVPMSLGRLQDLYWLNLQINQLDGDLSFITSLANCSGLQTLSLYNNQLSGMLPDSIANFSTQLQGLYLARNKIFGTIPAGIVNLANLRLLSIEKNLLTGIIPVNFGNLQKLEAVGLNSNKLSGKIPSSIGNLTRLYKLVIDGNDLKGSIPSSLGNCQNLQELYLSENNFDGTIPEEVLTIPSITKLFLDENSLTGSLPMNVDKLEALWQFDVSNNELSGKIPSTLGSCTKLEFLHMGGNFFQGSIPPSFSALKGLQELDLSSNNLTGQIPKFLERLPFLQYLNLSFNNFQGEMPMSGVFQNVSAISVVGNDKLCGGVPELKLPSCSEQDSRKQKRGLPLRVLISIIVSVALCLFLLSAFLATCFWWRKKTSKNLASTSSLGNGFLEVSYAELLKATDGFLSNNLIGVGSYGSVYKGFLNGVRTTVAIKVLNLEHQRASKSFLAECEVLRSIRHRNIVKILTVCSSTDFRGNDFKALVFEYMPNGSLDMWLHPKETEQHQFRNLSFIERLNVAIDVACALDYLHHHCEKPVVHCDIKPSNILLDADMVAHVGDFGLARIINKDVINYSQTPSSSLVVKGSIGYVPPEYGTSGDPSAYGDVYSYGILLLEMFIGKRPIDDIFKDNLSLHQYAKMMLPERVMEIIDHRLLIGGIHEVTAQSENNETMSNNMQDCLISMVRTGVSCSAESPKERMEMKDVIAELQRVKDFFLAVGQQAMRVLGVSTSSLPKSSPDLLKIMLSLSMSEGWQML